MMLFGAMSNSKSAQKQSHYESIIDGHMSPICVTKNRAEKYTGCANLFPLQSLIKYLFN